MKVILNFQTPHLVRALFAREEENLLLLGKTLGVQAVARDNFIRLAGPKPAVERARKLLREILKDIPEIPFIYLTREDAVLHPLVQKIVMAYEQAGK